MVIEMIHHTSQRLVRVSRAAILHQGKTLMFLESYPNWPGQKYWMWPGGKVKMGEDDNTALFRELEEELGLNAKVWKKHKIKFFPYGEAITGHLVTNGGQEMTFSTRLFFAIIPNETTPPAFTMKTGQLDYGWFNRVPRDLNGGAVGEATAKAFKQLEEDGLIKR